MAMFKNKAIASRFSFEKFKVTWKIILKDNKCLKTVIILGAQKQNEVLKDCEEMCFRIARLWNCDFLSFVSF